MALLVNDVIASMFSFFFLLRSMFHISYHPVWSSLVCTSLYIMCVSIIRERERERGEKKKRKNFIARRTDGKRSTGPIEESTYAVSAIAILHAMCERCDRSAPERELIISGYS